MFEKIRLDAPPSIERLKPDLTGVVSGSFDMVASGNDAVSGTGSIVVSNFSLALSDLAPGIRRLLNLERFEFERITADLFLNGNDLEIQNGEFDGPQLKGRVSGNIFLKYPMPASGLDLEVAATPLLYSTVSEINEFNFRVTGTFEKPKFSIVSTR
jgi:type II secretion system protein N